MAHAGEVEIVDAHLHLINLTDLVYPWIESRKPALTALLPNLACEFGAADGVAEAVRVQGCADRVVFRTPSSRPCSSNQMICQAFSHDIGIFG